MRKKDNEILAYIGLDQKERNELEAYCDHVGRDVRSVCAILIRGER